MLPVFAIALAACGVMNGGMAYDASSPLTATLGNGLTFQLPTTDGTNSRVLRFIPSDGPGSFNLYIHPFDNPGDVTRKDQVMSFGYNCAQGSGALYSGEPAICEVFESHWDDGGGFVRVEKHTEYTKTNGATIRPITMAMRTDSSFVGVDFNFDNINWNTPAGQEQWMQWSSHQLALNLDTTILKSVNNGQWIKQLNAAGNFNIPILYLNSSDQIVLGDSTHSAGLLTYKYIEVTGMTAPAAPADGSARIYVINSAKDQLCVQFHTGAAQCIATEP